MFLLAFPILLLATLALGLWTIERLRLTPENPVEHGWIASTLGLLVLGTAFTVLGFAQILNPVGLWIVVLASIALGFAELRWYVLRDHWTPVRDQWRDLAWPWKLATVIGIALLLTQGLLSLAPNTQWDTLAHHFLVPEMFLKWGGIYDLQQVQQSYFPSLFQMLYAGGMGLGGEQTASLLGWWWSTLVILGLVVIGQRIWRLEAGIAAGIIMLTQELYSKQLQGGWADSGVALFVLLATYGLVRHWERPRIVLPPYTPGYVCGTALLTMKRLKEEAMSESEGDPIAPPETLAKPLPPEPPAMTPASPAPPSSPGPHADLVFSQHRSRLAMPWLIVSALGMGSALAGSKHNALLPFVLILVAWAVQWLLTRGHPLLEQLKRMAIFIGVALLPPLCWYIRSWILTGSPVYPLTLFGLFPGPELPVYAESSWIDRSYHRDLAALFTYPFMLTYSPSLVEGFQGRFPPQWPLLIPFLLWRQWRDAPVRFYTLLFAGTLALMFLVAPKETRYMLFAIPWLALLTGGGLICLLEQLKGWHSGVAIQSVAVLLLLLLPLSLRQRDLAPDIATRWQVVTKVKSRGKYLGYASPNTATIAWMNANLPEDAFVFCLEDRTYRLEPDWTNYYAATETFPQTAEESYTFCWRQGVTHLFLGDGTIIQAQILKNIVDLPPDANGISHFRLSQVMVNLKGELISPTQHWVAWTTVRRFLQRAGFASTLDADGVETFSIPHDTLLSTPVQRAHYNVMGAITEMHERRMMKLLKSDGLNMVFEYDYSPIAMYEDPLKFGVGRPDWTHRQ